MRTTLQTTATPVPVLLVDAGNDIAGLIPPAIHHTPLVLYHAAHRQVAAAPQVPVIVADIHTAEPGDIENLREIRRTHPDSRVVLITSGHDPDVVAGLLREGAFSILVRPVLTARLSEAIDQAIVATGWQDDIALLTRTPQWVQVQIKCKIAAAERAAQIFRELPGTLGPREHDEMATAFREMLMNAIEHGGRSDPNNFIHVSMVWTERALIFYIRDPGSGFSMRDLPHAAISNPDGTMEHAEVRQQKGIRPGGFGILLARNMVDELIYNERGNEVILVKHRQPGL